MSSTPMSVYPAPPAGLNYLAAIRPSLNMLILGTAWSSAMVPLLLALFLFSSPKLRRTPIFILNVLSISMGLCLGIMNYYMEITQIMSPEITISSSILIAYTVIVTLLPLFTESILVFRVTAVYPLRELSRLSAAIVYLPLICMKTARFVSIVVYWFTWFPDLSSGGNPIIVSQKGWHLPFQKIEWILQMLDNGCCSALFLWRLRRSRRVNGRVDSTSHARPTSYSSRINALFWIAISNFVFPVFLACVQLICSLEFKAISPQPILQPRMYTLRSFRSCWQRFGRQAESGRRNSRRLKVSLKRSPHCLRRILRQPTVLNLRPRLWIRLCRSQRNGTWALPKTATWRLELNYETILVL
ncbi:hypothetical protein ARMSODRAFT_72742 [Armillaria solidipes]|uniref:Uncharacterized protein n=1 Tax=Armillaria solidipes TaxID=1076256 RepID=A0A2H3BKF3_9AGAR|nr:hypothetical protein ARMSODRAFT_72742 [Armillaria solidipes]